MAKELTQIYGRGQTIITEHKNDSPKFIVRRMKPSIFQKDVKDEKDLNEQIEEESKQSDQTALIKEL